MCLLFILHQNGSRPVNALWAEGRLGDLKPNWGENHNKDVIPPTASKVNIWSISGWGHDRINHNICVREKCKRLGYQVNCPICHGEGELWPSEEAKANYENWNKIEPPKGEGWQMWETVSYGSPVSPVFSTKETFVNWLIREGYSEGTAEQFAEVGHAFSLATANGMVYSNLETLNIAEDSRYL